MGAILTAEFHKARANPTIWWLLLVTAALGALSTYLVIALSDEEGAALLTDHSLQEAVHGASVGAILVAVAGIIGTAGEWRFGQATQTFLTTARRGRVVVAKAVVYAVVGLFYGVAASATALAAAWAAYRGEDLTLPFDRSAVWLTLAGVVLSAVLLAMLGVAIGAVVRNQVAAIVGALAWFFLVEPIVHTASVSVARWLPATASTAIARFPDEDLLSPGMAALVLSGLVAAGVAAGTHLVQRADVTA
jgi:ABC-2 type transport system permease protein